jgi:hypothetical protein
MTQIVLRRSNIWRELRLGGNPALVILAVSRFSLIAKSGNQLFHSALSFLGQGEGELKD